MEGVNPMAVGLAQALGCAKSLGFNKTLGFAEALGQGGAWTPTWVSIAVATRLSRRYKRNR
jgi:hypothetical protein